VAPHPLLPAAVAAAFPAPLLKCLRSYRLGSQKLRAARPKSCARPLVPSPHACQLPRFIPHLPSTHQIKHVHSTPEHYTCKPKGAIHRTETSQKQSWNRLYGSACPKCVTPAVPDCKGIPKMPDSLNTIHPAKQMLLRLLRHYHVVNVHQH
jgi:hypothetical protein